MVNKTPDTIKLGKDIRSIPSYSRTTPNKPEENNTKKAPTWRK